MVRNCWPHFSLECSAMRENGKGWTTVGNNVYLRRVTEHIGENCGTKLKLANMSSIGNKNWQTWVTLATLGNALTRVDKGWQGLTRVVNYWSSFRTTGRTGEHWHWIGATLGFTDYVSLLILGGRLVERSYIVEQRGTTKNIGKRWNFGEHNWSWGWSKIKTSHLRD